MPRIAQLHHKQRKKRNKETKKKIQNPNYCKKNKYSIGCPENLKNYKITPSSYTWTSK